MTYAFEDFHPGHFGTFGPRRVTRDEILEFAREFDPQPMHVDEAAAPGLLLGGLSGSGWHLCALMMRLMVEGFMRDSTSMGSPGIDELRWLAPLRPDDVISVHVEVLDTKISRSRPDRGFVTFRLTVTDESGRTLATGTTPIMFGRRDAAQDAAT